MATAEDRIGRENPRCETGNLELEIRRAILDDVDSIVAIETRAFSNPWHPLTFRSLVAKGPAHVLVARELNLGVVGYAVLWWVGDQGELANVAVEKEHQGKGIGAALLDRVLGDARDAGVESLFLEVRESNEAARGLYLSRGFRQVAVRRGYYRKPPEDARILQKALV